LKLSDFDYRLPDDRIAQFPLERRDDSRLMLLDRRGGAVEHRSFRELDTLLAPGDLLVLNDTRVRSARLFGTKASGGRVELLLLARSEGGENRWVGWIKSSRSPRVDTILELDGGLRARVVAREDERFVLEFPSQVDLPRHLERFGSLPLPPYIERSDGAQSADRERYQTVYAQEEGAVAAPTAGLHFTPALLARLRKRGVEVARLTLHVGPGTFQPVRVDRVSEHRMHAESFELPTRTVEAVTRTRAAGGRVVAVGTTVVRTLESRALPDGSLTPGTGECDLFIYPGFTFRVVDAMITNFHLPRSTLLMLVAAFAGREPMLQAYRTAIEQRYRFYSYGDAMLLWDGPR